MQRVHECLINRLVQRGRRQWQSSRQMDLAGLPHRPSVTPAAPTGDLAPLGCAGLARKRGRATA